MHIWIRFGRTKSNAVGWQMNCDLSSNKNMIHQFQSSYNIICLFAHHGISCNAAHKKKPCITLSWNNVCHPLSSQHRKCAIICMCLSVARQPATMCSHFQGLFICVFVHSQTEFKINGILFFGGMCDFLHSTVSLVRWIYVSEQRDFTQSCGFWMWTTMQKMMKNRKNNCYYYN